MICRFVLVNTFKEGGIGQSHFTKTDHCLIIFVNATYLKWNSFFYLYSKTLREGHFIPGLRLILILLKALD